MELRRRLAVAESIPAQLPEGFSGLYDQVWKQADDDGRLEFVEEVLGPFMDTGTPADYLAANLLANGGSSVVGKGAHVAGQIEDCVVWDGCIVDEGEHLVRAIRGDNGVTVRP